MHNFYLAPFRLSARSITCSKKIGAIEATKLAPATFARACRDLLVEDVQGLLVVLGVDVEQGLVPPDVLREAHARLPVRGSLLDNSETLFRPETSNGFNCKMSLCTLAGVSR